MKVSESILDFAVRKFGLETVIDMIRVFSESSTAIEIGRIIKINDSSIRGVIS